MSDIYIIIFGSGWGAEEGVSVKARLPVGGSSLFHINTVLYVFNLHAICLCIKLPCENCCVKFVGDGIHLQSNLDISKLWGLFFCPNDI